MDKQLKQVTEFHKKFNVPIEKQPIVPKTKRTSLRYKLMRDEVEEYEKAIRENDIKNIAKELADILYATYGTILEHGLQNQIQEIFTEIHRSNLSKDFHEFKMVKGKNYKEADLTKFFKDRKK